MLYSFAALAGVLASMVMAWCLVAAADVPLAHEVLFGITKLYLKLTCCVGETL
jgi:hypothetical protein